ncbi:MAG: isoprenyl transferase [Prevotellaceae bacterium]|jgi:undecaprenyl diphosphate synthase|nr:isoprenyl transferase [Prevotellaceae bacterium]
MEALKNNIKPDNIPAHVAVIMDGNGRWAKKQGLNRIFGHQHAITAVRETTEAAAELGVKFLTLYTFSTENWNRPSDEINALMDLLVTSIEKETPTLNKNNIRLLAIGDIDRLPRSVAARLQRCIDDTAGNTRMNLVLALSYSSRWEILQAVKKIAVQVKEGDITLDAIDENMFSKALCTADMPDPDLLIRTSGEERISNFLLWQIAYSELYFTPVCWPDFGKKDFYEAILSYQNRERRFGKTGEQMNVEI